MILFRHAHAGEAVKVVGDVAAGSITIGAIMGYLPAAAAAITIIYTAVRLYETHTVQRLLKRVRG